MANQLSILPNYQTWCRLINLPTSNNKLPRLVERKIITEELGNGEWNQAIVDYNTAAVSLPGNDLKRSEYQNF
jgi:hypothetical protein